MVHFVSGFKPIINEHTFIQLMSCWASSAIFFHFPKYFCNAQYIQYTELLLSNSTLDSQWAKAECWLCNSSWRYPALQLGFQTFNQLLFGNQLVIQACQQPNTMKVEIHEWFSKHGLLSHFNTLDKVKVLVVEFYSGSVVHRWQLWQLPQGPKLNEDQLLTFYDLHLLLHLSWHLPVFV